MILHGGSLIVAINGNSMWASKSCTLQIGAKSIARTSPTSGDWEEVLSGKKSWSLQTNHFMKVATAQTTDLTGTPDKFYFSNSQSSGWKARGQWGDGYPAIDEIGVTDGIYLLEIEAGDSMVSLIKKTIFNKDGKYGNVKLEDYLKGTASIEGSTISNDCIISIMTVGDFVLNTDVCNVLTMTYHVALPCLQFGNSPVMGTKTYDNAPIIIVGGKNLNYGYTQLNNIGNELNFNLYGGVQVPVIDGIPGNIEMVGKNVTIRMTDENGSTWAGQAEVLKFSVTGTKGNLMNGSFSFKGNGELQTDKKKYDIQPEMPDKLIDRIIIDMNESNPAKKITGDVYGPIVQDILSNFHRYLGKYQGSGRMYLCQLDDNNSNFFYDGTPATLDGTMGDVFVGCEKYEDVSTLQGFFFKVEYLGEGKYMLALTYRPYSGFSYWSNGNLIAAFKAQPTTTFDGNTAGAAGGIYYLRSIANEQPVFADTFANLDTQMANMNSSYFGKVGPEEHAIIAMLYYMKYGNTNCQTMLGSGGSSLVTGATTVMGMKDTDQFTGVSFSNLFGLEDWWSKGEGEYMERIRYSRGKIYITPWGGSEDAGTAIATAIANEETVIRSMLFSSSPLKMIPSGDQGAQSKDWQTYFCDAVRIIGLSEIVTRGKGDSTFGTGLAAMKLGRNNESDEMDATRLCFRTNDNNIILWSDVQMFINSTAVNPAN